MESELFLAILSSMSKASLFPYQKTTSGQSRNALRAAPIKSATHPTAMRLGWRADDHQSGAGGCGKGNLRSWPLSGKGTHAIADDLTGEAFLPSETDAGRPQPFAGCFPMRSTSAIAFSRKHTRIHALSGTTTTASRHSTWSRIITRQSSAGGLLKPLTLFIHQRATEKGVVKGSTNTRIAIPSPKIICGECGDTFKRWIHSCTGYKYAAWCRNTHIKNKDKCHMLL